MRGIQVECYSGYVVLGRMGYGGFRGRVFFTKSTWVTSFGLRVVVVCSGFRLVLICV